MTGNKNSGRPAATWYFYGSDIEHLCTLSHPLTWHHNKRHLVSEDIMSLLTFVTLHLSPTWRKKLQVDTTLTTLAESVSVPAYKPILPVDITEAETLLRWTINTNTLMESLGCSQNQIHIAKCREHLNCGKLISVLRFALFRARPLQRATIIQGLFSQTCDVPAPRKKYETKS